MLIIDDLIASPVRGFFWLVKEIHDAARQEIDGERARLTDELGELHRALEGGTITEEAFDEREEAILARLEELSAMLDGDDPDADSEEGEHEAP